jgi:hypothetical protein
MEFAFTDPGVFSGLKLRLLGKWASTYSTSSATRRFLTATIPTRAVYLRILEK